MFPKERHSLQMKESLNYARDVVTDQTFTLKYGKGDLLIFFLDFIWKSLVATSALIPIYFTFYIFFLKSPEIIVLQNLHCFTHVCFLAVRNLLKYSTFYFAFKSS